MVVALGPGRFYGSSLPRPRFFSDVKLNPSRVDPPTPVMDPLLSWANDAHWSMGGLNFKRLRLMGRIEGSIKKLRAQRESTERRIRKNKAARRSDLKARRGVNPLDSEPELSDSGFETSEEEVVAEAANTPERKRARKLADEFEKVAGDKGKKDGIATRTRSRRSPASPAAAGGRRSSLRKVARQEDSPVTPASRVTRISRRRLVTEVESLPVSPPSAVAEQAKVRRSSSRRKLITEESPPPVSPDSAAVKAVLRRTSPRKVAMAEESPLSPPTAASKVVARRTSPRKLVA